MPDALCLEREREKKKGKSRRREGSREVETRRGSNMAHAAAGFSQVATPRDDAVRLYKAFKGFGCDTATVVDILAHRDTSQRPFIQHEYRSMYGEELTDRLHSELSGDLKKAVLLWIPDPAMRDATIVKESLSESGNMHGAIEVLCSRTPSQIATYKQAYLARFGLPVEHDIEEMFSGDTRKLLLAYISTVRYEGPELDPTLVEKDGDDLYKAGEKRLGTDEKTFIRIFCTRSAAHLAAVSSYYSRRRGRSLAKAVKNETSGNFEFSLLTILRCSQNPAKYFAKRLYKSMKGLGTNDAMLIRTVVGRAEIDMPYIKAEYHKKYGKPLAEAIHSDTSGHYRKFLLSLVDRT